MHISKRLARLFAGVLFSASSFSVTAFATMIPPVGNPTQDPAELERSVLGRVDDAPVIASIDRRARLEEAKRGSTKAKAASHTKLVTTAEWDLTLLGNSSPKSCW